ncbi:MAG: class I SAM-dependent methyltransferase [Myxococcales bacterium]|nr:class I SAM-dependent methyltransferase [Myxococcales bacterium]
MSSVPSRESVRRYYDSVTTRKLRDFVDGNARVERAWETIRSRAPLEPQRTLEIGCGVGQLSWQMRRHWPHSEVTALDISPRSIELARSLFGPERIEFVTGRLEEVDLAPTFDLITMVDVYEHIAQPDRAPLHAALGRLMSPTSRLVLTFPTPRFLRWLREHDPANIQPIDEAIEIQTIEALARDTRTSILLYAEQSVWHNGDYAHAVLGREPDLGHVPRKEPQSRRAMVARSLGDAGRVVASRILPWQRNDPRAQRLTLLRERLGYTYDDIAR